MARNTIDFGIDLGTTNSEIAVVDKGHVNVIRNGFRDEITPSAVRIDRKGSIIVGKLAFNQRVDDKENGGDDEGERKKDAAKSRQARCGSRRKFRGEGCPELFEGLIRAWRFVLAGSDDLLPPRISGYCD